MALPTIPSTQTRPIGERNACQHPPLPRHHNLPVAQLVQMVACDLLELAQSPFVARVVLLAKQSRGHPPTQVFGFQCASEGGLTHSQAFCRARPISSGSSQFGKFRSEKVGETLPNCELSLGRLRSSRPPDRGKLSSSLSPMARLSNGSAFSVQRLLRPQNSSHPQSPAVAQGYPRKL